MSKTETARALIHAWANGGRLMMIVGIFMVVFFLVGLGTNIYVIVKTHEHPPNPLQSPSPEQITNKLPAYHVGDTITILGAKCNASRKTILIRGTSWWQNMEAGAEGSKIPSGGNSATGRALPPGCMPLSFPHLIPNTLTPGKWAFVGEDCTDSGQCASWFSDSFVITGAP